MKSYSTLVNFYTSLSQNTTSQNEELGSQMINDTQRYLLQKYFNNEGSSTAYTVSGQQGYVTPANYSIMKTVTITIGLLRYTPVEVLSRKDWDLINMLPYNSDIPNYYFIYNGLVNIWPIPSSNGNLITYNYKFRVPDLNIPDYKTGTVSVPIGLVTSSSNLFGGTTGYTNATSVATTGGSGTGATVNTQTQGGVILSISIDNPGTSYLVGDTLTITGGDGTATFTVASTSGSTNVTGSGTTWTITQGPDEQRWIQFTGGDQMWYQVKSVNSTTSLTLTAPYQGTVAVSGSAYILGQMPVLYEDFQDLLVYRPLVIYFSTINKDIDKMRSFEGLYNEGISRMNDYIGQKSVNVDLGEPPQFINPNLFFFAQ